METVSVVNGQQSYALVRAVEELFRVQREAAARLAREMGCPRSVLLVLRMLDLRGPLPLGEIATGLRVDMSVASRHVSKLVDEGLAERSIDSEDRRSRTIALTSAGRDQLRGVYEQLTRMAQATFVDWTDDELAQATETVERVTRSIASAGNG